MNSWISYKRQRNDEELHESYRIAQKYPLVESNTADTNNQQNCQTSCQEANACFESENSSIDSAPSSAPLSPANSVSGEISEISSPDDCIQTIFSIQLKSGIWGLTPTFSHMKDDCTEENIQYVKHSSFSHVKGAIAAASSALTDSSSDSIHSPYFMPSLRI